MYSFGLGLMHETFTYFGFDSKVRFEKLKTDGTHVRFFIEKGHGNRKRSAI